MYTNNGKLFQNAFLIKSSILSIRGMVAMAFHSPNWLREENDALLDEVMAGWFWLCKQSQFKPI